MKTFTFTLIFTSLMHLALAQSVSLETIGMLPSDLDEASGIQTTWDGNFWVHNDSGDDPTLYLLDANGLLLKKVHLMVDQPIDLEDLAKDEEGTYFIGDFGNNSQSREDLSIYKLIALDSNNDSVAAERIGFRYLEQNSFPSTDLDVDCEAMIHFQDHLYLFSKNVIDEEYTYIYKLPDTAGDYTLSRFSELKIDGTIRAADLSPDGSTLVLVAETFMMVYWDFAGDDFASGNSMKLFYPKSKKEGVTFLNNQELFIVDDKDWQNTSPYFYKFNLAELLTGIEDVTKQAGFHVYPNPSNGRISLTIDQKFTGIEILDLMGRLLKTVPVSGRSEVRTIDLQDFSNGSYFVNVRSGSQMSGKKITIAR